ncbi:MFS transporter [Breoghania sp. L-A4]|uniref:MFS transporter n=1 Tax=Breoghania sp. L-A4 TaxID=2304600 RepID=UPI000E360621|nr:MFS transporter [Breoghania sp. L-A4]AXS42313.1 MFS transporter [Breoghania sp. L-A4]
MADNTSPETGRAREPGRPPFPGKAAVFGWILFDWASQPYFTLVTTFVFAPYFAASVAETPVEGQALWGYAAAAAGLVVALLSPVLGAVADAGGRRKRWLLSFSAMLVAGCAALWFAVPGSSLAVPLALGGFMLAGVGAEFAIVFTNAMMPDLVPRTRLGRLSGQSWAVGYAGGLVSLVLVLGFLAASPQTGRTLLGILPAFGLDPGEGARVSGPLSALWYAVFVLPLFLFVPDRPLRTHLRDAIATGLGRLTATLSDARAHHDTIMFLAANMAYKDGLVALFAFGGIYAAGTLGWGTIEIGLFGILLTVTGTLGALIGGWLDDRLGPKPVLVGALAMLIVCSMAIVSIGSDSILFFIPVAQQTGAPLFSTLPEIAYLVFGGVIGACAGPLQSASRTMMIRVSPPDRITEFFGLFALSGKATSFIGPLAVAALTTYAQSQRVGISVIVVLLAIGMVLLARVKAA